MTITFGYWVIPTFVTICAVCVLLFVANNNSSYRGGIGDAVVAMIHLGIFVFVVMLTWLIYFAALVFGASN